MEDASPFQYKTPFRCPECGEHVFQTDAVLRSEFDFLGAECTNCGHALTREEIETQKGGISSSAMDAVLAQNKG